MLKNKVPHPNTVYLQHALNQMSSIRGQKAKGGKPISGASSVDAAILENSAAISEYTENPKGYSVFIVGEDVGISKKSSTAEYVIKGVFDGGNVEHSAFVPRSLLSKNGKLAIRTMGLKGARLLIKLKGVTRLRDTWHGHVGGGCMATVNISTTEYVVSAVLP